MPKNNTPKRFISIRLTEEEFKTVTDRLNRTTCHSLTEYVRKRLLGRSVTVKVRNESQDELLQEIINVKNLLTELTEIAEKTQGDMPLLKLMQSKALLTQIAKKCLQ